MFTGRIYPLRQTLNWTKKYLLIFFIISLIPYLLKKTWTFELFYIPWLPIALIGTAVAFYLGFKNNASYERLWEARIIFGNIANLSRILAIYSNSYITNHFSNIKYNDKELIAHRQNIIKRHVAWLTALRFQLRKNSTWEHDNFNNNKIRKSYKIEEFENNLTEELSKYLTTEEINKIRNNSSLTTSILDLQGNYFQKLRSLDLIEDFRHIEFASLIKELLTEQGNAERIKNFPFPRQYASLNIYFVWLFIFLLPFGMLPEFEKLGNSFDWLSIPFCMIVSWVFHTMEMIGDYSENPFEGSVNDVPITTISKSIEKEIFELTNIPTSQIELDNNSKIQF